MSLMSTARGRLFFFGALYFAQGVPWGFISVTLALYLTGAGMGEETLGRVIALSYLPWAFKPLLGPFADGLDLGRLGRRRPWILGAQLGMGVTLLVLAALDPRASMPLFLGLLFMHNAFAAAQDLGVDALAIELLGEDERGTGNSVMWASKYAGVGVGGAGFSAIGAAFGWRFLFLLMAALVFLIAILPALVREPPRPRLPPPTGAARRLGRVDRGIHVAAGVALCGAWPVYARAGSVTALWYVVFVGVAAALARTFLPGATPPQSRVIRGTLRAFTLRATLFGLLLFLVAPAASGMLSPLFVPLLKNRLGYSDVEIGTLNGLISSVASVVGALAGGILSDKLGRRRAIVLFTLLTISLYAAFGALSSLWSARPFLYGYVIASSLATGMLQATYLSLAMDLTDPAVGGTQFTTYMAVSNLRNSWSAWAGGLAAAALATPLVFALAAAVQAAALLLLPLVDPEEAKRAFRKGGGKEAPAAAAEEIAGA